MNRMNKAVSATCILGLVSVAHADFTSIDTSGGFGGVALSLEVSDFMGNFQSDTTFQFGVELSDYPNELFNTIQTPFGVSASGTALVQVLFDSPNYISTTGSFTGSANTFGVQGAAQGGAGGGIFFGFTLDTASMVEMNWYLEDSLSNNADDLGTLRLYEMNTDGPVLLEINQDGSGNDMSGTEMLNLAAGHYLLFASSEVIVHADEFNTMSVANSGFGVDFAIVPAPASASIMFLSAGFLASRRRR